MYESSLKPKTEDGKACYPFKVFFTDLLKIMTGTVQIIMDVEDWCYLVFFKGNIYFVWPYRKYGNKLFVGLHGENNI